MPLDTSPAPANAVADINEMAECRRCLSLKSRAEAVGVTIGGLKRRVLS